MSIYGHKLDEFIRNRQMESGNILEVGNLLDGPKLIKAAINDFKKYKNKKRLEKAQQEDLAKATKEHSERYKKLKEEFNNLTPSEKQKLKSLRSQKEKEFEKLAKTELKKLMSDKEFTAQIRKDIDKGFKDGWLYPEHKYLYNNNKMPAVHVKNEGDYWEIIDDDQEVRIVCSAICDELAKRLEKLTGYSIGTGDGDEGCIYPNELIDGFDFYCSFKGEIKED